MKPATLGDNAIYNKSQTINIENKILLSLKDILMLENEAYYSTTV